MSANKMDNYPIYDSPASVYKYNGYSLQELLSQFYAKIQEVIDGINNHTIDIKNFKEEVRKRLEEQDIKLEEMNEWLRGEGLVEEVKKNILLMYEDGTLSEIINEQIFGELNDKIDGNIVNTNKNTTDITNINSQLEQIEQQTNDKNVKFIACAIRNTGSGFEFINDTMHNPLNGATLVTESGRVTLNYGFTAKKVLSLIAVTDETLAQLGFNVGTSVGLDNAKIYFSKQDKVFGYLTKSGGSAVAFTKTDNISNGIIDLVWESGAKRLKITHDKCYNPIPNIFTRNPEITAYPIAINRRGGFTTTYIGFRENRSLSSIIRYLNDNFTKSGDNGGITGLSWDSVNSRLTVNHKSINNLCVNLTSRVLGLQVIPYLVAEDYVVLEFYKDGQKITTPTTDINFILNKQSDNSINIIPPDGTIVCMSYEGLWDISPSEITYANSNIWLIGIMEV